MHLWPVSPSRHGANDLFIDLLDKYRLPEAIVPLVEIQITKMLEQQNEGKPEKKNLLQARQEGLLKKLKEAKVKLGLSEIDRETFDLTLEHINQQQKEISKELESLPPEISNFQNCFPVLSKNYRN